MWRVNLLHQFHTTTVVEPCVLLAGRHTKRHRGKIQSVRNFAFPVIRRGVSHVVLARFHHIKHTQWRFMFVGRINANL
ncbi:Uncharacterised protein [Vibrio cholerae]|uniref:Uncharacterized protein n=1 Tax=Vibrio cholerae TaxID=666 RepID=A0A655PIS0_VIBCL|nr:Uncharacterised protein [Vibrio cholerae]CSA14698.1 Uncharacterised protein [Vibrio cholerae]